MKIPMRIILAVSLHSVLSQYCDFIDETVPVRQPDGSTVCVCDRSKGYIGQHEYACAYVNCPTNMEPDDKKNCQCVEDFYLKDNHCIQKTRCNADEVLIHNGSRYDDRKCVELTIPVDIRDPPLVRIADITSTSVSLEVFRNPEETGLENVNLTIRDLTDGVDHQRDVTASIAETRNSVSVVITELAVNTSYHVEVITSSDGGTSDPATFAVQTKPRTAAPLVNVKEVNQTSCRLEITPDTELGSGKIYLTFENLTDNRKGYVEKEIERGKPVTALEVTGLVANTSYQMDVKIDDSAGLSDARQVRVQTTAYLIKQNTTNGKKINVALIAGLLAVALVMVVIAAGIIWWKQRISNNPDKDVEPIQEVGDGSSAAGLRANLIEEGVQAETAAAAKAGAEAGDSSHETKEKHKMLYHPTDEVC